jgi:diguanylate cyclase (GGDEF)-like protein
LAWEDELTGLPNRRRITQLAREVLADRRSLGAGTCIGVMDIDHFKSFNDRFGHDIGDFVLREFAGVCRKQLRSADLIGRFGGEEFLVVLTPFDASMADAVHKRLSTAVANVAVPGFDGAITFSMGVAVADGDSCEALVKRADEALYQAKAAGRNRAVVFEAARTPDSSPAGCGLADMMAS